MEIEKSKNGNGYVLTNKLGNVLNVSFSEFWEICREGSRIDTKHEVQEYLSQCPDINGHDLDRIRAFPELVEKIMEQVIQDRINDETGDQIYYAAEKCINSHIATIENKVKWFRLSEDTCISVWYAPDKHDGDQFQMHLEKIGEDGIMGPGCEILSDESYATDSISYSSLCKTLIEICNDANISNDDVDDLTAQISGIADEIFCSFGMKKGALSKTFEVVPDVANTVNENGLSVSTPLGNIVVTVKTDSTYPGVYVDLKGENVTDVFEQNTASLAMIEFEPSKGKVQSVVYGDAKSEEPTHIVEHENVEKAVSLEDQIHAASNCTAKTHCNNSTPVKETTTER